MYTLRIKDNKEDDSKKESIPVADVKSHKETTESQKL